MSDTKAGAATPPDWYAKLGKEQGFLSRANPLATEGQLRVENRALALLERPELKRAHEIVTLLWRNGSAWPQRDQAARFEMAVSDHMFHHAMRAANCDFNHPEVARFMLPAHRWFGRDLPGSRWGGDSPDFTYRTIPIAHGGSYEIRGTRTCAQAPIVFYSLMSEETSSPITLTLLESLDMDIAGDGSFTITVDATPANGRRNHIETKPGSEFLMIRDSFGDWIGQTPNALTVRRLDPAGDPRSEDELARHAAKIALEGFYYTYYITKNAQALPPNEVRAPMSSALFGGVATQWGTKGTLDVGDGEAIVIRCNAAGAQFRNLVMMDTWMLTNEYWKRTSSLNHHQMAPDADGDFTFVIAHEDPGIHNWLDTGGLQRFLFGQRWQAFTRDAPHDDPWMTTKVVKFDALAKELPEGVQRIDSEGRKAQIAARKEGFARRFIES